MESFLLSMKEGILNVLHHFKVFNENALYYTLYFMKNYWIYLIVIAAILYMFYSETKEISEKFVDDERRML